MGFTLRTDKTPAGDQPAAIEALARGIEKGQRHQTLLGVTGSGKTFTVANVIQRLQKPTLVIAHNKTLAAQLAQEYKELFPDNAVHYFVSYYDYYQPEAYMPGSDTYIEKEALVNKEIDRLRHATTQSLLTRTDVIVVASVSVIYGLGSPESYRREHLEMRVGKSISREAFVRHAIGGMYFERTRGALEPGKLRVIGNAVEIMPTNEEAVYRIVFEGANVAHIQRINALTRELDEEHVPLFFLFPAKHFVSSKKEQETAIRNIKKELKERLQWFDKNNMLLEKERLRRRTLHDLSLIGEVGYCTGIENYSRHFEGRKPGEPAHTLLSYFPKDGNGAPDFITVIDESHVTVPQIAGMYAGDRSRKNTLVEHGFRLPSAVDNRPLTFEEFSERVGPVLYTSATPGTYERDISGGSVVEQVIRPTGLLDPVIEVRPITGNGAYKGQVQDFLNDAESEIRAGRRVLVTTLTKKNAEDLAAYLSERSINARYFHGDVKTIERVELLTAFRKGEFDVLVGVNLLREGLDLPEVSLVGILDADKEGFLRSETSLIQTIGRAARNVHGRVVLYADTETDSLRSAVEETRHRREKQMHYNREHGITPRTVQKNMGDITEEITSRRRKTTETLLTLDTDGTGTVPRRILKEKKRRMADAVAQLDFKTAALLRDEIEVLEERYG